jgi:hypothetical protein
MVAGVGSRHNNVIGRREKGRSAREDRPVGESDGCRTRRRRGASQRRTLTGGEGRPTGEPMTGEQGGGGGAPCPPAQAALE